MNYPFTFMAICAAIYFKIPARMWRGIMWVYDQYRIKTVFHYIEYKFHGAYYHTRRSGPLNDLEGNGLLCEVKKRGGVITYHKESTKEQIAEIIAWRANEIAEWQGQILDHAHDKQNSKRGFKNA